MRFFLLSIYVLLFGGLVCGQATDTAGSKWSLSVNFGYDALQPKDTPEPNSESYYQHTNHRSFHFNMKTGYQYNERWSFHIGAGMKTYEIKRLYVCAECFEACLHPTRLNYQFFDLPLEARYYFGSSKFKWHVTGGITNNFRMRGLRTVQVCHSDAVSYYFTESMPGYLPGVNLGGGGQINLTQNLAVTVEATWLQYFKSLDDKRDLLTGGPTAELGFQWRFNTSE